MPTPAVDVHLLALEPTSVVVVAGGDATRFGSDKVAAVIEGQTVLDWVLDAWSFGAEHIAVGPVRPTRRPVRWCRERPPGGGPAAAVAAALPHVGYPWVALAAADAPLVGAVVSELRAGAALAAEEGADGAWLVDGKGQPQPLAAIVRLAALHDVLIDAAGDSLLRRLKQLRLHDVRAPSDALRDVDTRADEQYVAQLLSAFIKGGGHGDLNKPTKE